VAAAIEAGRAEVTTGEVATVEATDAIPSEPCEIGVARVIRRAAVLPARRPRQAVRAMQVVLLGLLAWGLWTGAPKTITNATGALVITFLPAIFERNYELVLDPWLALWITAAAFLHTLGSAGLYGAIPWWDHVTHSLSASLVAGTGYVFVRAIDLHSDEIRLPHRFMFVYILVVVMAFGVVWELFEYGLDVAAEATALTMPLAQHGIDDTVVDLTFNAGGAVVVAVVGHAHLTDVSELVVQWRYEE